MTWPCTLKTDRLVLRPWRENDVEALLRYASDPEVGPRGGWNPHRSLDESRNVLHKVLMVPDTWAICMSNSDEPIGAIALMRDGQTSHSVRAGEAWIGYWLGHPWWGKGIMPEAAQEVMRHGFLDEGLSVIWGGVFEDNPQSMRVLDKAGFSKSAKKGTFLDANGKEHPEYLRRITREEWEQALMADPGDENTIAHQQAEAVRLIDALPLVSRVRSGGQTGADRGGLDAARDCKIPICGWCPPGGLAEDCPVPPGLMTRYPELKEGMASGYVERTAWNVRDSHATLIVSPGGLEPKSGTEMTAVFARRFGRPVLVLDGTNASECVTEAFAWLNTLGMRGITLNVAGPRESKVPGVYELTHDIVLALLKKIQAR